MSKGHVLLAKSDSLGCVKGASASNHERQVE